MLVQFLLEKVGQPASSLFFSSFGLDSTWRAQFWFAPFLDLLSVFFVFILISAFGWLSNYVLGRFCIRMTERLVDKVPFIRNIYKTVKQIVDTFSENHKAVFQKTVLIEYPYKGSYSLGFLTGTTKGEIQDHTSEPVVNVFIPTTPNPTSGFLLMIPASKVQELNMSVGDGMKMIISGGAVVPKTEAFAKKISDS